MISKRFLCLATSYSSTLAFRPIQTPTLLLQKSIGKSLGKLGNPSARHVRALSVQSGSDPLHNSSDSSLADKSKDTPSEMISFAGKMVPLGPGFTVRRVLPFHKQRSVGPFVFLDHFGPVDISDHAMNVGPHPHIGLMTLTYLYEGAILHRDSTGAEQIVIPGEVNGMIAGKGVTHSERGKVEDIKPFLEVRGLSTPKGSHGLQIWMALSKEGEDVEPSFHHGESVPINSCATLVVGQSNGIVQSSIPIDPQLGKVFYLDVYSASANETFELFEPGGTKNDLNIKDDSIEVGIYVSCGKIEFVSGWGDKANGEILEAGNMVVVKESDAANFRATIRSLESNTRAAIIGGTPLPEKRQMFWNFVSASKEKVDLAAKNWELLDRAVFPKVINESNNDSIPLPSQKRAN